LDSSPIDAESWSEIADLYLTQGLYEQAIFSLEEVLLVTPNAWNIHARLGEVLFLAANKSEGAEQIRGLSEAMRRFCRSVELCDDYLRGYYGLKLVRARSTDECYEYSALRTNGVIVNESPDLPATDF
jgi:tetratricopeptide (TPR) repeat protein